jgi:DNA transposition AAA+ family ATPase
MTHSDERERIALQASAEHRHICQAAVQDYIARTGMDARGFAGRIGFGYSTLRLFLTDKYHNISANDGNIIRACESYMATHPIRPSLAVNGELFETANVRLIRSTFAKLLQRPRAFMIYAPPGSQKTFVLQHEVYALNEREIAKSDGRVRAYFVRSRQDIRPRDMMKRIAVACGVDSNGNVDRILTNIRLEHAHRRCLLAIDEAQQLSIPCFEVIRELLDCEPYFSLLFSGSHDLFLKFEHSSATLEQWNSRIAQKVRLPGCTPEEALAIVEREAGAILAQSKKGPELARKLIARATVPDIYVPVANGKPKATYINIRTLCNALDDLKTQYAAKSAPKEDAA